MKKIDEQVELLRRGKISRREFLTAATALLRLIGLDGLRLCITAMRQRNHHLFQHQVLSHTGCFYRG